MCFEGKSNDENVTIALVRLIIVFDVNCTVLFV